LSGRSALRARNKATDEGQDGRVRLAFYACHIVPTKRFGSSLTAQEVCEQLDGLMSTHTLLKRARQGQVPGAFKVGARVYFARNTAAWLVTDLSVGGGAGLAITTAKEDTANGYFKPR
jgi:hypothetical protein